MGAHWSRNWEKRARGFQILLTIVQILTCDRTKLWGNAKYGLVCSSYGYKHRLLGRGSGKNFGGPGPGAAIHRHVP